MRAEPGLVGTPFFLPSIVFYTRPERDKALSCAHGYGAELECRAGHKALGTQACGGRRRERGEEKNGE